MFVSPMLLQYAKDNKPFNSAKHISELKLDGFRLIASRLGETRLYTRHGNDVTAKFPELLDCPFPNGCVLDGELIISDDEGKPDFEALQSRFQSKRNRAPVTFCAFDIIRHRGVDVTALPLSRRKKLLADLFEDTRCYKKVQSFRGNASDYFEVVRQRGLEGIVMKDDSSKYDVGKRSWSWQKIINWTYAEVYISGYLLDGFGMLASAPTESGGFRPVGIVELGSSPLHRKAFNGVKRSLVYKEDKKFAYMRPVIKIKVKTRNWTKKGMLRSPVFVDFVL